MGANHSHDDDMTKPFVYAEEISDRYMDDDGVISYFVSSERKLGDDPIDDIFERLEDELGIQSERVYDKSKSELDIAWTKDPIIFGGDVGRVGGYCVWVDINDPDGVNSIVVDETLWDYEGIMVHEVGHALGLDHDHEKTGSIMSYGRDREQTWFNDQDIESINHIYSEWVDPRPESRYNDGFLSYLQDQGIIADTLA